MKNLIIKNAILIIGLIFFSNTYCGDKNTVDKEKIKKIIDKNYLVGEKNDRVCNSNNYNFSDVLDDFDIHLKEKNDNEKYTILINDLRKDINTNLPIKINLLKKKYCGRDDNIAEKIKVYLYKRVIRSLTTLWFSDGEKSIIGWGIIENTGSTPKKVNLSYKIDKTLIPTVNNLQVIIFKNSSYKQKHVTEFELDLLSKGTSLSASFDLQPGINHVLYGPSTGYFDPEIKYEYDDGYSINIESNSKEVKWLSKWAGDATVVRKDGKISYVAPDIIHNKSYSQYMNLPKEIADDLIVRNYW